MFVPFGEFAPDQAILGHPGSPLAMEVIPVTADSYGPFLSHSAISGDLTARCQGAISVRAADGTIHVFAGDATKLYKLNSDGVNWDNVSRAAGYTTPSDGRWYFVQMGNRIVATNYTDEIQTYVIGSSALFANLAAAAPKARFIAVIKGFLVAADTWDATDGYKQERVWWANHDDPTLWPTPGTAAAAAAQSDFQDIQFGGQVNGILGGVGGRDGVVFLRGAIVTMDYVGGGVVFAFNDAERGRGTSVPTSIINIGPGAGYLGEEGFMLFDGSRSVPIGAGKVDRFFFDGVPSLQQAIFDQTKLDRVCAAHDAKRKLIYWGYADSSGTGNITDLLIYNWELGRWSYSQQTNLSFIFSGYTAGYTLEGLDAITTNLEVLPYSLDSQAWMGGRPVLAGFNALHKFGYFDGSAVETSLMTKELTGKNGRRLFIRRVRPICDAPVADAGVYIEYRNNQNATKSIHNGSALTAGADGTVPIRLSARYTVCILAISAGATWHHAKGFEVDAVEEGSR